MQYQNAVDPNYRNVEGKLDPQTGLGWLDEIDMCNHGQLNWKTPIHGCRKLGIKHVITPLVSTGAFLLTLKRKLTDGGLSLVTLLLLLKSLCGEEISAVR